MNPGYIAERSLGYAQITSLATAAGLSGVTFGGQGAAGIPSGCTHLLIIPEGASVRWRDDGTDPTATIGQPLAVGAELRYTASTVSRLKFIEQVASGKLNIVAMGS